MKLKKLFVQERGQHHSETIVFLHALGCSSTMWQAHLDALTNFHCIAIDLPGHGRSNDCEWKNLYETTTLVANIIKTKTKGKAHVVGVSLGSAVAMQLMKSYPQLITKAIIEQQPRQAEKGAALGLTGLSFITPLFHTNAVINRLAKIAGVPKEAFPDFKNDIMHISPATFWRGLRDVNSSIWTDIDSVIKMPVLVISGEKGVGQMPKMNPAYTQIMLHCQCVYYPGKACNWVAEDIPTHIALCRYWFENGVLPKPLKLCAQAGAAPTKQRGWKKLIPLPNEFTKN